MKIMKRVNYKVQWEMEGSTGILGFLFWDFREYFMEKNQYLSSMRDGH